MSYGFQNPFLPNNQYMPTYNAPPQQMQVVRVNGRNGAEAYSMGPNSSALLLDESGTMVWLATTDGAGYKTINAYDINPHQETPPPDYSSFEARLKKLEDFVHELTGDTSAATESSNAKPSAR